MPSKEIHLRTKKLLTAAVIAGFVTSAISMPAFGTTIKPKPKPKATKTAVVKVAPIIPNINLFISGDTNIQDLWQKTLIPAFQARYPKYQVTVTLDLHGLHDAQTISKVTAAAVLKKTAPFDIADGGFVAQLGNSSLLAKQTVKTVPNLKYVDPTVLANGKGGTPYRGSSVLLAYNSANVANPPKTLDGLLDWIKANPGKFTYNAPSGGGSGYAFAQTVVDKYLSNADRATMVADYVPELESKWAPGLEMLRSLNPYTYGKNGTYPANNAATLNLLASGQVDMGTVWSDQFITAKRNGTMPASIKVAQIKNPSLTGGAVYLGIPLTAKNLVGARVLANWVISPEAQNLIIGGTLNGYPVIPLSLLDPTLAANFADADITSLRPPYFSSMGSDLKNQWATTVPGK